MSTAVITPVNPMAAEGKDTVMTVLRRDRDNFTRLVSDPKNWNVDTRCTGWEVRDLVGHMIDVMEGYFKNWEAAEAGRDGTALGLPVMGETLNDHALEFRKLSRDEALARCRPGSTGRSRSWTTACTRTTSSTALATSSRRSTKPRPA